MSAYEATLAVIDVLTGLGIPYVLARSYASNSYGVDRSTMDADFVVELGEGDLSELLAHLHTEIRFDPQMGFETITMTRKHVATVEGSQFQIELFQLSDDPNDREWFRRRLDVASQGRRWIILAVVGIITKLRWARSKDKDDVRDVVAVQDGRIDWDYVHSWCECHGTREFLNEIRASMPPI